MTGRRAVLVTDLDRTFTTEDLRLDEEAILAAKALRAAGVRLVLATGRPWSILPEPDRLVPLFDGFALECGQAWGWPGHWRPLSRDTRTLHKLASDLRAEGVPVMESGGSFSIAVTDLAALRRHPAVERCALHANVDRVDVVPRGVDKGRAVAALLRAWAPTFRGAVVTAVADGDNDVSLRSVADRLVAVANAGPALRAVADEVAPLPASRGFAWVAAQLLEPLEETR